LRVNTPTTSISPSPAVRAGAGAAQHIAEGVNQAHKHGKYQLLLPLRQSAKLVQREIVAHTE
jgi:hypothetical protein